MGKARGAGKGGVRGRSMGAVVAYEGLDDAQSGIERGLLLDAEGREIWRGYGDQHGLMSPGLPEGGTLTHFHPNSDFANLSSNDLVIAAYAGGTMRSFTRNGDWFQVTFDRPRDARQAGNLVVLANEVNLEAGRVFSQRWDAMTREQRKAGDLPHWDAIYADLLAARLRRLPGVTVTRRKGRPSNIGSRHITTVR